MFHSNCDIERGDELHGHNSACVGFSGDPKALAQAEELPVTLHAAESAYGENTSAVDGEEGAWNRWCISCK
jgi:hypothetical protein